MMEIEQLKYPIGNFAMPATVTDSHRSQWMNDLATLPGRLEAAVATLNDEQLDTPYRPEGWTVRQVVHHVANSHIHAFCRIKWTLTEDSPTVKPYNEADWAAMHDERLMPIHPSLDILRGVHQRLVFVLKNLSPGDLQKLYIHPGYGKTYTVENVMALYAWHGNHHLAHITGLKNRMGWD